MMDDPGSPIATLIAEARFHGVSIALSPAGDTLILTGPDIGRETLRPMVREHKPSILAYLRAPRLPDHEQRLVDWILALWFRLQTSDREFIVDSDGVEHDMLITADRIVAVLQLGRLAAPWARTMRLLEEIHHTWSGETPGGRPAARGWSTLASKRAPGWISGVFETFCSGRDTISQMAKGGQGDGEIGPSSKNERAHQE